MNDPRLTAYVLGELEPQQAAEVELLLKNSAEARIEVEKIRRMTKLLREELGPTPPPVSSASFSKGLTLAIVAVGIILASATLFREKIQTAGTKRVATVILDPPVQTNPELKPGKSENWVLTVDGTIPKEIETEVIKAGSCYKFWSGPPEQAPRPAMEIMVDADGRARVVKSDSEPDANITSCLVERIGGWRLSTGPGQFNLNFKWVKKR